MQGKEALLRQLALDGVKRIYGNPGTVEQGLLGKLSELRASGELELEYILTLQESIAVAAADGEARATKRPAVVQLHTGVGLGNGIGMLYQALRGGSPLVVIAGDAGVPYDGMDAQMACDLVAMAKPVTKYATRVTDRNSLLRIMRRAYKIAATPPMGPVFVGLPMDILDAECEEELTPTRLPSTRVAPDEETLSQAAALLLGAKDPLILCGDGVAVSGAQEALAAVAEKLGAPVYGVNSSEPNLPKGHGLWAGLTGHMFGKDSRARVAGHDVILICGTYVFPEVFPNVLEAFDKNTQLIHFDLDAFEISKNFPAHVAAVADPKLALRGLERKLEEGMTAEGRAQAERRLETALASIEAARSEALRADAAALGAKASTMPQFARALAKALKDAGRREALVVFDEALTESGAMSRYLGPFAPGEMHQTRGGSLGVGIPGALGVQLAQPDKLVVAFTGDGGAMYTIQALWTAVHHRIPARFVTISNGGYKLLKLNIQQYWAERKMPPVPFPSEFGLEHPRLDFKAIAESYGVPALRIERPEQMAAAVEMLLGHEGPVLIDLAVPSGVPGEVACNDCGQ